MTIEFVRANYVAPEEWAAEYRRAAPEWAETRAAESWQTWAFGTQKSPHLLAHDFEPPPRTYRAAHAHFGFGDLAPPGYRLRPYFDLLLYGVAPPDIRCWFYPLRAWLTANLRGHLDTLFERTGGDAAADPSLASLQAMVDEYVAANGTIRTRGEDGPTAKEEREWLEGFMLKIGTHWPGRQVEACLEAHGIGLTRRAIDDRRRKLVAPKRRG